ncbi:hypothetical protein BCR34DRAFT_598607 [Clohesyomyces aquaticus]|uniref:Uncharacterized protein n=1 Tax=Clohesyomyces aquaticus TaxID=1231657 RepID=A0A1Y1ZY29_9PLEO|nr:hypothetical protein BCR34DRAFT_598607 [Clohesyomyces aquaticus]
MSSTLFLTVSFLALTSTVRSTPLPQSTANPGLPDKASICAVTYDDPAQAWVQSGASHFLDNWLLTNGETNWVNRMDQMTTNGGKQGTSNLNCVDFAAGNCPYPTSGICEKFTPPSLYHVRNAISTAYNMFKGLHEALQNVVIKEILNVDTIVADFGPPKEGDAILGALNAALGIGAGLTAAVPEISGPLSVLSSAFGMLASTGAEPIDPTIPIEQQLAAAFDASESSLQAVSRLVFGGDGDTSKLPGTGGTGPNGENSNIAKFFANGKFLVKVSEKGAVDALITPVVENGARMLRQRLVSTALKSQGYYVFVDQDRTQDDCNGITGSRWIENQCFTIEHFRLSASSPQGIRGTTKVISKDIVLKFDDPNAGYNINVEQFYRNADACQNAHPGFDGNIDPNGIPTDGSYPQCFFNIPVVKAKATPCLADNLGALPGNLEFSEGACEVPMDCPGHPRDCI